MQDKYKEHHTQAHYSQTHETHTHTYRNKWIFKVARENITKNIDVNIINHLHLIGIWRILNPPTAADKFFKYGTLSTQQHCVQKCI